MHLEETAQEINSKELKELLLQQKIRNNAN